MHYFQFEIKEWVSNTAHLTLEEEAIYLRLINYYYDSESAFSEQDVDKIFRKCRIQNAVVAQEILKEFFFLEFGLWVHSRCDLEIQRFRAKSEQASKAGKASAQRKANARSTDVQPIINHKSLTINHKSNIKTSPVAPKVAIPIGVSESVWNDFLILRKTKKMAVTATALKGIAREAAKADKPLEEVLSICCERGWGGFKADWLDAKQTTKSGGQEWRTNDGVMLAKASELGLHTVGLQRFEIVNKIADTLRSRGL